MTDYIYPNVSQEERVQMLKKMCRTKEQRTYTKSLSDVEVAGAEKKHAADAMRIQQLKDDLKEHTTRVKGQIKELDTTQLERLEEIANRRRQVYDWVYGLPDQQGGKMMFYDGAGELIDSRELYESEKQKVLFVGEDGQTAAEEANQPKASESVLSQFQEYEDAEMVEDNEPGYEPGVHEEKPNEDDLEDPDAPVASREAFLDEMEVKQENQEAKEAPKKKRTRKPKE